MRGKAGWSRWLWLYIKSKKVLTYKSKCDTMVVDNLNERQVMKHIIYPTEPDFEQASEYIEGEADELIEEIQK